MCYKIYPEQTKDLRLLFWMLKHHHLSRFHEIFHTNETLLALIIVVGETVAIIQPRLPTENG